MRPTDTCMHAHTQTQWEINNATVVTLAYLHPIFN